MNKKIFTSMRANIPKFPYSQSVIYGDLIFISSQPPVNPESGELVCGDIGMQTRRILNNISNLLTDAGTSLCEALKVTAILKDRSLFGEFNLAYNEFFDENPPARTTIYSDTGSSLVLLDMIAGMKK